MAGSPTAPIGGLVLWRLRLEARGVGAGAVALALVASGLVLVGGTSLEAAERRSSLVGQLRFAATMPDPRTVIVLRRQPAMELPRLLTPARIPVRGSCDRTSAE